LKFLIEALWDVALFELTKGDIQQGILLTSSGKRSPRITAFYSQKLGKCVSVIKH
jgi:hypothetical protein